MTTNDAGSTGADPASQHESHATQTSAGGSKAKRQDCAVILGLALVAGLAAWLVGEASLDYFKPSRAAAANYQDPTALNQEMPAVRARNGVLTFGALGGLVGLALGLAGGFSRRSANEALLGALVGLILGCLAGALPSLGLMPYQWRHRHDDPNNVELLMPFLIHLGLWSGVGLAAGLAFGLGRYGFKGPRLVEAAFACLVGAMAGTFVFELLGALLLPMDNTANAVAQTATARLLARICVAGFVGLGAIRCLSSPLPSKSPPHV
jgi:hypothetical protein